MNSNLRGVLKRQIFVYLICTQDARSNDVFQKKWIITTKLIHTYYLVTQLFNERLNKFYTLFYVHLYRTLLLFRTLSFTENGNLQHCLMLPLGSLVLDIF